MSIKASLASSLLRTGYARRIEAGQCPSIPQGERAQTNSMGLGLLRRHEHGAGLIEIYNGLVTSRLGLLRRHEHGAGVVFQAFGQLLQQCHQLRLLPGRERGHQPLEGTFGGFVGLPEQLFADR